MKNTCTHKSNFGMDLMKLGKINANGPRATTELEEKILGRYRKTWYNASEVPFVPNEGMSPMCLVNGETMLNTLSTVFLFEMTQLADADEARSTGFRADIQRFLGLKGEVPPMDHQKPGRKIENETAQAEKDARKIDICRDEYRPVREDLMRIARLNSEWIRESFVKLPGIHISTPDYFNALMEVRSLWHPHLIVTLSHHAQRWMHDPCENGTQPEEAKSAPHMEAQLDDRPPLLDETFDADQFYNSSAQEKARFLATLHKKAMTDYVRPPYEDLVKDQVVVGDPQFL